MWISCNRVHLDVHCLPYAKDAKLRLSSVNMSVQGWAALPAVCRPGQGHEQRRPGDFGASYQEQKRLKRKIILIFAAPPSNTKALQPWQKVSEQAKKIMPWKLISMELLLINVLKTNFHRRPKTQDSRSSKHRQVARGEASQWVLGEQNTVL